MITGAVVYWIMEVGVILDNKEAHTADGLWEGLDIIDQGEWNRKAELLNTLIEKKEKEDASETL